MHTLPGENAARQHHREHQLRISFGCNKSKSMTQP